MDLDKWIERVKKCEALEENELKKLCLYVQEILVEEPNVVPVNPPVTICGDIHGQFHDLLELFKTGGELPDTQYIFMGDFVDRGFNSLETLTYLLLLKARYPGKMYLLRGNHECRQITTIYGFYDEIVRKYGNGSCWKYCCEVFDCLNVAALVDNKILCIHGGLSPHLRTIAEMQTLHRRCEIPHEGAFCDLVWSDPESIETWEVSPRGAGWLFGSRVTKEFNQINDIDLICRAHQLIQEGYKYHYQEKNIVTVWSAPNYCYRCANLASILQIGENLTRDFKIFKEVEENHKTGKLSEESKPMYFL